MMKLKGIGVALVTPFDAQGEIDYEGLKKLLTHTADNGADYYVVQGTTGESATTTKEEKSQLLQFVKKNNPKKLPIVYGLGGNNTQAIKAELKGVALEGVDAILSVSPYYNKPSQKGIAAHYQEIADASPVPVILYNVPGRTGSNILSSTTLELSKHANIIGVKEASGNLEQAMDISKNKPSDFMLISGDDVLTLPLISVGAVGVISVLANPFPNIFKNIFDKTSKGDYHGAAFEAFKLLEINPLMYSEGNPVGVKQALKELDICDNHVRLPLLAASSDLKKKVSEAVGKLR